jgi:hypothetical protein
MGAKQAFRLVPAERLVEMAVGAAQRRQVISAMAEMCRVIGRRICPHRPRCTRDASRANSKTTRCATGDSPDLPD